MKRISLFVFIILSLLFLLSSSVNAAELAGYAKVSGYVKDAVTKAPLGDAKARLKCGSENQDTDTNSSGYYEFPSVSIYKNNNTYISQTRIIVSLGEYKTEMKWIELFPGQNYTQDFYLETRFKYPLVTGQVIDADTSIGIAGAAVTVINEQENYSCLTDAGGYYTLRIEHKGVGKYTAYAAADNYLPSETQSITTYPTKTYTLNFSCVMAVDLPPAAPQGLSLAAGDGLVYLSWSANTETDLAGYNIYRAQTSGGPYLKLNASQITQLSYTDSGLNNGTTYYYVITAVDNAGNESGYSAESSAIPAAWLIISADTPDAFSPNNDENSDVSVLSYELSREAAVTLSVYDTANQAVRVLEENISKPAGTYAIEWDGKNGSGEVLSDGAYTYVLKAQDSLGNRLEKETVVTLDNHFMRIIEPAEGSILYQGESYEFKSVPSAHIKNITDVCFYSRMEGMTDWKIVDAEIILNEDGSYSFSGTAKGDPGAKLELYVSAAYVDLNNEVRTEYSTPVTYVFYDKIIVRRASDAPDAFSPNGSGNFDESFISYEIINEDGFVTTKIFDENSNLIKVLEDSAPKTMGTHTVIWNGRSRIDGDFAADGTYSYVITAEDGEGNRHEKQGEVSLDNHFMRIIEPMPETLLMGEVTFKAVPSPYTRDIANVHFLFSPEETSQTTGYEAALQPDGTWSCVWNADNAQSGRYGVRVSAYYTDLNDQFRSEVTKFDMFTVPDYVRISDVFDENDAFSPNEDGNCDTGIIHYSISKDALMSVELFNSNNTLVRTLKQDINEPAGTYSVEWDGKDDASNVLNDGTYTYVITAKTPVEGYISQKQGALSIDNHSLVISPAPGTVVSGNVIFTLKPSEYISTCNIYFSYRLKGERDYDGFAYAKPQPDGNCTVAWDTELIVNGEYEVLFDVSYTDLNGMGRDEFDSLDYTVSNPVLILDVSDAPDAFSPNSDGQSDTTTISYQLVNSGANVSIKIYDGEGVLVRVLKENISERQGVKFAFWDGKDSNESVVSDGIYTYRIEAADAQGNTAQKQGQVTVDNHAVTIIEPQEGGVVSGDVVLHAVPSAFCQNVRSIYFNVRHTASYVYFVKNLGPAVQDSDGSWTVQWSTADIPAGEYELYALISFIDNNGQMRSERSARIRCTLATGNMLSYISDAPDAFSPNGDGKYDISTISYVLSIGSSVNLKIYDAQGLLVRTLKENETQTVGFNNNLWDGRDDNGNVLPDGLYTYVIEADYQGLYSDKELGTVTIDNLIASFVQPVPDSSISSTVTLKIMPSPYMSEVTGISLESTTGGGRLGVPVKQSDGSWEAVWDTSGCANGSYNVRAYVMFMDLNGKYRGEWTKAQVYTIANGMAVSRNAFSPNGDGYYDTTAFLYNMASAGAVTVKIYGENKNPDSDPVLVRVLKENIFEQAGQNQAVWDGKDDNANVLSDGIYSYVIHIDYGSGNTAYMEGTVAIDNHFLRITQPAAGDSLSGTVNLTVAPSAYIGSIDMRRVRFYYRKKGDTSWQQINSTVYQQPDGTWQLQLPWNVSAFANGEYEVRVTAPYKDLNNLLRTETSLPVTYKIANPFSLINVSDAPDAFSPNGDNNSDTTTIKYFINSNGFVIIRIYDAGGNLLRTLKENILETAGNHTAVWDGKDLNGLTLNDGTYTYVIKAIDNQGSELQQSGESSIDNTPIHITEPLPGSTISGQIKLKINFSSFVRSEGSIYLETTSLMRNFMVWASKDIDGSWSIPIDTKIIPNGPFEFKIFAGYSDLNNKYRYELSFFSYTVFNEGPDISDLTVTPNPFSPDGSGTWLDLNTGELYQEPSSGLILDDEAIISFTASDYGVFDVKIVDEQGNIVTQLNNNVLYPDPQTQRIEMVWDGSINNSAYYKVKNGTYRVIVNPGSIEKEIFRDIIVDKIPFIKNTGVFPNPFNPHAEDYNKATITYSIEENAFVDIDLYADDVFVTNLQKSEYLECDQHRFVWSGMDSQGQLIAGGNYTIVINAHTEHGATAEPAKLPVFVCSTVDVGISSRSLNPYDNGATVEIYYTIRNDMQVTLEIYNDKNELVRMLVNDELRIVGRNTEIWDGKDDSGGIVPDGFYYFTIKSNFDGQVFSQYDPGNTDGIDISMSLTLTISDFDPKKNIPCTLDLDVPEPVYIYARIRPGRWAHDDTATIRLLKYHEPCADEHFRFYWDGRDETGDIVPYSSYFIGVWGYRPNLNSVLVIGGTPKITVDAISINPIQLRPYDNPYRSDQTPLQTAVSFNLSREASVTAGVYNTAGILVASLAEEAFMSAGNHTLYWDGISSSGTLLPKGYYRVVIQAHYEQNYSDLIQLHAELVF